MNSNIIIIIGSIIVAFIFVTWLVRYIRGLKKTRDFYQNKINEMRNGSISGETKETADTSEVRTEETGIASPGQAVETEDITAGRGETIESIEAGQDKKPL